MKLPSVVSILKKYRIMPKKQLGQNFLIAMPTVEKIVTALGIRHTDDVLEIGPGLGIMTALIARQANQVIAVEKDRKLASIATQEFGDRENIKFIIKDILKIDFERDLPFIKFPLKVCGNIPYNISSPILFKLFDNRLLFECAILMIQKEVADRILARPNTKDYGILAILSQTHADCRRLFDVRPTNFLPPPQVNSSVIRLDFGSPFDKEIKNRALFKKIVKAAFGQRRKTLKNTLMGAKNIELTQEELTDLLLECKIDPMRRAETLLIDEYVTLSNHLHLAFDTKK